MMTFAIMAYPLRHCPSRSTVFLFVRCQRPIHHIPNLIVTTEKLCRVPDHSLILHRANPYRPVSYRLENRQRLHAPLFVA